MVQIAIVGKYQHYKSENLDQYFYAIGAPYLARKIIAASSPLLEITVNEENQWCIQIITFIKTITVKFKLQEEFLEIMPFSATLKSTAKMEGNTLTINSVIKESGVEMTRDYDFDTEGCVITLKYKNKDSTIVAKRCFKRIT